MVTGFKSKISDALNFNVVETFFYKTNELLIAPNLMLQFGILVFILSLVCLLAPNYFGLYGGFMVTIIPLFFTWFYSVLTLMYVYMYSQTIFINGFK